MAQYSFLRSRPRQNRPGVFDELRQDMDRLFHQYGAQGPTVARGVYPPVNFHESGDNYVLTAELPGVDPADINVSLQGSTVTVEGERKRPESVTEGTPHRLERSAGTFKRAFELPVSIDGDGVVAKHANGVLMLTLPKAAEHRPRQISIQAD